MQQPHPGNENRFAVVQPSGNGKEGVRDPLGAGAPQRVGWFRFYFDDDRWEWSPQVEKMHGYLPGSVTPTTDLYVHLAKVLLASPFVEGKHTEGRGGF